MLLNHILDESTELVRSKDNNRAWVYKTFNVLHGSGSGEEVVVAVEFRDERTANEFHAYIMESLRRDLDGRGGERNGLAERRVGLEQREYGHLPLLHAVKSYSAHSKEGFMNKRKKTNQDAHLTCLHDPSGALVLGVFDGHGPTGEIVSGYLRDHFTQVLFKHHDFPHDDRDVGANIGKALKDSIKSCEDMMYSMNPKLSNLAGSTAVIGVVFGRKLFVANVGDSRLIGRLPPLCQHTL